MQRKNSRKSKEPWKKKINLTDSSGGNSSDEGEMIAQLKETFHIIGKKSEKFQILMILPNSWSLNTFPDQFFSENMINHIFLFHVWNMPTKMKLLMCFDENI
jgi:hypothetical protein